MKITTAAAAFALALSASIPSIASADTINTHCAALRVGNSYERQCTTTVEHEAPAPAADPGPMRGPSTSEQVRFDRAEAERILAIPKHDPASIDLCPAPWHMTARDGCRR